MGRFARVVNGTVIEIFVFPDTENSLIVDDDGAPVLDAGGNFQYEEVPLRLDRIFSQEMLSTIFPATAEADQRWLYNNGQYSPPPPPPEPPYIDISLPVDVFFERTTEEEAEEIETAMLAKPVKIKRAYQAATTFKEGTDLWAALRAELENLFGTTRRDELMARPTASEMSRPAVE